MFEKYYTTVEEADSKMQRDNQQFEDKLSTHSDALTYFQTHSSSYYQKSQIKFDQEMKKFEARITESLSDCQKYYSDLKFSDGYGSGRARWSTREDALSVANHRFNPYENYQDGQHQSMSIPPLVLV